MAQASPHRTPHRWWWRNRDTSARTLCGSWQTCPQWMAQASPHRTSYRWWWWNRYPTARTLCGSWRTCPCSNWAVLSSSRTRNTELLVKCVEKELSTRIRLLTPYMAPRMWWNDSWILLDAWCLYVNDDRGIRLQKARLRKWRIQALCLGPNRSWIRRWWSAEQFLCSENIWIPNRSRSILCSSWGWSWCRTWIRCCCLG